MKHFLLLTLLTLSLSPSVSATSIEEHDHSYHEQNTDEVGIYDEIEELLSKRRTNKNVNFGQPGPFLGLPMKYPVIAHMQAEPNIAQALHHNGQPIVLFGPNVARNLGPNIMGFFLQHEYAHHDRGHLRNRMGNNAAKEADADCIAAKTLVNAGKGFVINEVSNWFSSQGCNYNPSIPVQNVTQSHPCGIQRANIIQQCAAQVSRRQF